MRAFFEKWVARWPTVQSLAVATDDDVRAVWAGLGYYRRCVLHRTPVCYCEVRRSMSNSALCFALHAPTALSSDFGSLWHMQGCLPAQRCQARRG